VDRFTKAEISDDGQTVILTREFQYNRAETYYVWWEGAGRLGQIDGITLKHRVMSVASEEIAR
jgi:hypothetical protein